MALIDLYLHWEDTGNVETDPQSGDSWTTYAATAYQWNTVTRQVETDPIAQRVYLAPVADTPPADVDKPGTELVDSYLVPSDPAAPGYDAAAVGQFRRVYHGGSGEVVFDDEAGCDVAIVSSQSTAPSAPGAADGTLTVEASSSQPGLQVRLLRAGNVYTNWAAVDADNRHTFTGLPAGTDYSVQARDGSPAGCLAEEDAVVDAAPLDECGDPDATNYVPGGTNNALCRYAPRWVGAWAPGGVLVAVTPNATPAPAYVTASLWAGFPVGHPLAVSRPLAHVVDVRATVGPDGVARVDLAPYLRPLLGAAGVGGVRRLDLNSPSAHTADLYVGWALYVGPDKLAHGYALNSALDELALEGYRLSGLPLAPFGGVLPTWPGFDFPTSALDEDATGRLGEVAEAVSSDLPLAQRVALPCPAYALPVAWLTPEGSWAYWVFRGHHQHGDQIGEGQAYTEGGTAERRYSSRAASYRTVTAWSGVFNSRALADGLRTLLRAVQVWYQPDPLGPWVPVVLGAGSVPAYREGRARYEATISFTEAQAQAVQGQ